MWQNLGMFYAWSEKHGVCYVRVAMSDSKVPYRKAQHEMLEFRWNLMDSGSASHATKRNSSFVSIDPESNR